MDLPRGHILQNRYFIRGPLGMGGMGTVYLAEDNRLGGRQVAVKELLLTNVPPEEREARLSAFRQEAMLLAQLRHPGIASVSDFFFETGTAYLVMEYVPGMTLRQFLQQQSERRLAQAQVLDFAHQLCEVLDYLHRHDPPLVFRDLKPENVMVQPDGRLKLIDFGIARLFKMGQQQDTVSMGTPGYASPEHYGQGQTDPRSDIYSLGIMLHEMLTGQDPSHRTPFLPLDWSAVSGNGRLPALKSVVQKATQLNVALRYFSIAEMQASLPSAAVAPSARRRSVWAALGAFLLLVLAGAGIFWLLVARTEAPASPVAQTATMRAAERAADRALTLAAQPTPEEAPAQPTAVFIQTPTPEITATSTPEPTPEQTLEPTPTPEPPTAAPTATNSPTPTPFAGAVIEVVVSATQLRTETGLMVRTGQQLVVEYLGGSWRAGPLPTWPLVGPEGDSQVAAKSLFPVPTSPIMTLVAGIGQERPLPIGNVRVTFVAANDGLLWLGPNDDNVQDNAGSLTVRVTLTN